MNAMDRVPVRYVVAAFAVLAAGALGFAQAPGEPIVADVIPIGNRLIPKEQILGQIHTKPGNRFNQATLEQDAATLRLSGAFSDVRMRTQNTTDNRVNVYIDLAELPSLIQEIQYRGAKHIKQSELEALTGLRRGTPLNPIANRMACNRILDKLNEQGRRFASVQLDEGDKVGDTRVVFNITEGPETKIRSIEIVGHGSWVSSAVLKTQIQSGRAIAGLGGSYNARMVDADVMSLVDYYKTLGYLDIQVSHELVPDPDPSNVKLVFHIQEGMRYRVGKIQLNGNKVYSEDQLMKLTNLKEGQIYDRKVIQADVKTLQNKYGYYGHRVVVQDQAFQTGTGEVTVQYEVIENPAARAGEINIIGNERTRESVIRRQLGFYPGQILSWPEIQASEDRLANLGIFEVNPETGVRPRIVVRDLDTPGEYKTVDVIVNEASTGTFMLGVGVNSDAGLTGQIVLNERNFDLFKFPRSLDELFSGNAFRGGGQEFRLEAMPGTQFQRYTASWREPSLFNSPFQLAMSGYYYTRGFLEYNEERIGGRFTLGRQLNRYWTATGTVRVEGVNIYNIPANAPPDITRNAGWSTLVGFRGGITRDSRDSYLRPTTGSVFDLAYEQVTGTYNFPITTAEFSKFWTTYQRADGRGKHVLSFRTQASFAGDQTPVFERFYGGGFRSLRGFAFRGVGPFENGYNVGGQFSYLNTLEYQIPVLANEKFFVVGFMDAGTVERKFDINDYRVTAGLGFRIVTPVTGPVPIAFDFGIPIVKGPNDRKQLLAFYVGFSN